MRHLLCRLFAKTESSLWHLRFYFWLSSFLFLFSETFGYCSFHFPSLNVLFLSVNLQSCFFIYSVSLCFCSNCFLICLSVQSSAKPILTNFRDLYLIHSLVHDMLIRYFCHLLWVKQSNMCVKLTYILFFRLSLSMTNNYFLFSSECIQMQFDSDFLLFCCFILVKVIQNVFKIISQWYHFAIWNLASRIMHTSPMQIDLSCGWIAFSF